MEGIQLTKKTIKRDKMRTFEQGYITLRIYAPMERSINLLIINSLTTKATIPIHRCTIKTEVGAPPNFNTTYAVGMINISIPPTTVWYNFTFPVAADAVIKGFDTESIMQITNIKRTKTSVY